MEPGSQIIVNPGISLWLKGCTFNACSKMWKGIYLDTLGSAATTLSAKFCIFKDAEHAITAMKNSKVILSSNIFTDNLISVYTPDSNFYYASGNNNPPAIYIGKVP